VRRYIQRHVEQFKFLRSFQDDDVDMFLTEFKRFLVLKAINDDVDDSKICPSIYIDKLWVSLMTLPTEYHKICNLLLVSSSSKV